MDDTLFNTLFVADESVERDDASLQERGSSEDEDRAEHRDEGSHIATDLLHSHKLPFTPLLLPRFVLTYRSIVHVERT